MKRIKLPGKIAFVILLLVALYGLKYLIVDSGLVMKPKVKESVTLQKADLPTAPKNATTVGLSMEKLPSTNVSSLTTPLINYMGMAWNAQMGFIYSNGGEYTTEGSIMEKAGVRLHFMRQDDCGKMQEALINFATKYKNNPQTTDGIHFCGIMGDGSAAFLAGLNPNLEKLGPDYIAQVVCIAGYSYGEDGFMGPPSWKTNPQNSKGGVVAAVIRDGDWNIVIKWAFDNGLKVNPDEKTWDADAINFVNANDFLEAAQKYIVGYSEERDVVKDGTKTGEKKKITVQAVTSWTPADVNIAEQKGGLVKIVSTKEYSSQMPCVIIGIKKYCDDNRDIVQKMIEAICEGGDQVKSYSSALEKAGEISASIYKEQTGDYWVKYYKGVETKDKQGINVKLGGSKVCNLGDNLEAFGLVPGSINTFDVVYNVFGKICVQLYPDLLPSFPKSDDITNLSFLRVLADQNKNKITSADVKTFESGTITEKTSQKDYHIEFPTGSFTINSEGADVLEEIYNQAVVAKDLKIEINGHTDNVGNPGKNMALSQQRADAVKYWLMKRAPNLFSSNRINTNGYGDTQPIEDNSTSYGKAKNRRVNIVLGR